MVPSDVGDGRSSARGTDHTHAAESGGKTWRGTRDWLLGGRLRLRLGLAALCATGAALGAIWASTATTSASPARAAAGSGGSLTVLEDAGYEGAWPTGLDPATNLNGAANQSFMNAIYGNLFELGPKGKIIDDLATGYAFSDGGDTVTINIRPNVTFSNGDPFTAQNVANNITRDLASSCTCSPKSVWPGLATPAVTVGPGADQIQLHFSAPYAAVIHTFIDSDANWIADLPLEQSEGESTYQSTPVGAGPFTVVSDTTSQELVLKRNTKYWQSGHPLLANLTFKVVADDESAYEAMLAGQGQVYEDASSPQIESQASKKFKVVQQASTSPYDLQFNTSIAPLNSLKAREALYYATNTKQIVAKLFNNKYPLTQSFTSPGGLFYEQKVPGYLPFNLKKAKALVKQLGGLTITMGTINVPVAVETVEALKSQWAAAGITTNIVGPFSLAPLISWFTGGKWQVMLQTAGSWDPAAGVGVAFRFGSMSPFSGVHDPHLDSLLNSAAGTFVSSTRKSDYDAASAYIAKNAYGPFLFSWAPDQIFAKSVSGPGLSTPLPAVVVTANVLWEDVAVK
jgi:peptide/nickel transport system substrate-binding protein